MNTFITSYYNVFIRRAPPAWSFVVRCQNSRRYGVPKGRAVITLGQSNAVSD